MQIMNNIFADRYQRLMGALNSRASTADEQATKQLGTTPRPWKFEEYDYNPWQDITPSGTRQAPTHRAANAVGYDILFSLDHKVSFDDLKKKDNVVDSLNKERCIYQWSKPFEDKTAKQASTSSTCSNKAVQLNWQKSDIERLGWQGKDTLVSGSNSCMAHKGKTLHVSTDRKRKKVKSNDYPQWEFQDAKDEVVCEKKQRKSNKHGVKEHKRKVNVKEDAGGSCDQCKSKHQMGTMIDDAELFTSGCHWLPS